VGASELALSKVEANSQILDFLRWLRGSIELRLKFLGLILIKVDVEQKLSGGRILGTQLPGLHRRLFSLGKILFLPLCAAEHDPGVSGLFLNFRRSIRFLDRLRRIA
jgi:hypothetical protein